IKGIDKENPNDDISSKFDSLERSTLEKFSSKKENSSQVNVEPTSQSSSNKILNQQKNYDFGTTTLITSLVMYSVGAMLANPDWTLLALEVGGITAILLQFKLQLHQIADRLGENDMKAIMQFVMISFVILPLLPNRSFGPFDIFNPYETWLMVVLIVGMSLAGYVCYRFFGENTGILLGGIFGGTISSAATTICYARMEGQKAISRRTAATVILIATSVSIIRLLVLSAVVSDQFFYAAFWPSFLFFLGCLVPALFLWYSARGESFSLQEHANPTQWRSALTFGLLYAGIAAAMKIASVRFGSEGICWVAGISGLTDTTAVTLSTARLSLQDSNLILQGWRVIIISSLANILFKWVTVGFLAGANFAYYMFQMFLFPVLAGMAILFFWG
ncbi:MAG: DUF4010 domain-containing protein, partial [Thermoguttaceae bacterium]|nr:DUF4010 domain-containing protein [Thermoguttaceae bacterium]